MIDVRNVRRVKRGIPAVTAAALLLLSSSTEALAAVGANVSVTPHQASFDRERSAEEWAKLRDNKIEWDELQALVHEYNPTVSNAWITFRQEDHNGAYNIDYEAALSAIDDNYDEAVAAANGNTLQEALAAMQQQVSSAQTTVDSSAQATDREAAKLTISKTELTSTETIRKSIISYYSAGLQQEMDELTAKHLQTQYETAERKQAVGSATSLDTLAAKESAEQAKLTVQADETARNKTLQLIRVNLGWKYNDSPELCAVPMPTEAQLSAMELEADTKTALSNNYSIAINERKLAVSQADTNRSSLSTTIENEKQAVRSDMISRSQAVRQAQNALAQAQLSQSNAENTLQKVQRNYNVGAASARDLENAQYAADTAALSTRISEYSLATAYYDYVAAVNGLATADQS